MTAKVKSSKDLIVFEALTKDGFQGLTIAELVKKTDLHYAAVRRSLLVLEAQEWVVPGKQSSTKEKRWIPSEKLVGIAHNYRKYLLNEIGMIKKTYRFIAGEEISG